MKNIFKFIFLLTIASLAFTACEDDEGGQPVIKYIRPTDADAADSLLTSASMGSTIAIIGENLQDVNSVIFNDQEAKLNPVYVTASSIVVTVPSTIPDDITNTLTLSTSKGKSIEYDFTVNITAPIISSISCEWAQDGDQAVIYGSYFFEKSDGSIEVLFPGNLDAEVSSFADDSIVVTVPDGALSGTITVTNDYGTGRSSFTFRDETGIFITGENQTSWNWWGLSDFGSEADSVLNGAYLKFEGTTGSWSWPANALQLFYINSAEESLISDPDGDIDDYALKFEYYCVEWHDTPLLIWFNADNNTHSVDGDEAQYHWKPYDSDDDGVSTNYKSNGWLTMTMPLEDFVYSKDESETDRAITSFNELQNLHMMWFGAVNETTTEFGLRILVDNIRLVKIN